MSSTTTTASPTTTASIDPRSVSILSAQYRATTLGMVALVALFAFEALAVAAAMPTVARELDGLKLYALAFGGTLATSVIGMPLSGRWSDRSGPAAPLWAGLGCFLVGLLVAGLALNMPMLVVGRLLQGLGAGALIVALYVVAGRVFPEALRPKVFAAFSAGWVVPSLVGPALSGLIVQHIGWRWVFLSVPLLAVPAALILRPALRRISSTATATTAPTDSSPVPWAIGAASGALLLYVGGQYHDIKALALLLPALALLLVCSWKLLPAGTLRVRRGLPSVIALRGIIGAAFFGCEAFLPLLLSRERGMSPLQAGIILSLGALGWAAGSWFQGHQRLGIGRQRLLHVGTAMIASGVALTTLVVVAAPLWLVLLGWTITGLGMGLTYPSLSVLTLSLSPPERQGVNSSALQLSEAIAVAATLAVGGSLFAALLEHSVQAGYGINFGIALLLAIVACLVDRRIGASNAA